MSQPPTPMAFIYDRHTTDDRGALERRLKACVTFARNAEWDIAGYYIDNGPNALSDSCRPALDRALYVMSAQPRDDRELVLLVHDWERISRDLLRQGTIIRLARLSGGRTQTVTAGDDTVQARARLRDYVMLDQG